MLPSLLFSDEPTTHHEKEVHSIHDELTARAISNAKSILRRSVASQCSTATSGSESQRYSFSSQEDNNNETQTRRWSAESGTLDKPSSSFSSLPPSSRFLLSGATSSESFRQQELNRFLPCTPRQLKSLSDPFIHTPPFLALAANIDPWCMSAKLALDHAVCSDWLHKHHPSTFTFGRAWKRRFIAIVDRTVYVFKSAKPTIPAHEHFLLTEDTMVFVSENNSKKGFVLELRKPLCQWHLRCSSVAQMKEWLETMKKIVGCAKLSLGGSITKPLLDSLQLTDDYRILKLTHTAEHKATSTLRKNSNHNSLRRNTSSNHRRSLAEIPDWEKTLPPPMPPPQGPPPLP